MPSSLTRNLITGGAGFVGSHLVDRLMEAAYRMLLLDNLGNTRLIYSQSTKRMLP